MGTVTIAKLVSLGYAQAIVLPADFLSSLLTNRDELFAVMILMPSTKILRIIPTKASEVLKATIEIGELSPIFLQELAIVFMRLKLKTLFSTGICFSPDSCVYEGYIDVHDLTVSADQLKRELSNIEGILKVNIDLLTAG